MEFVGVGGKKAVTKSIGFHGGELNEGKLTSNDREVLTSGGKKFNI